jgi:chemotaxis protein CheC
VIKIINNLNEFKQIDFDKIKLIEDFDNFSLSIIIEIGNILAGHYTSALANLLSIKLIPTVPNLALDTLGSMTNCIIARCSQNSDFTLILETKMSIEELELTGVLCFISSIDTINKFLKEITKKYNI